MGDGGALLRASLRSLGFRQAEPLGEQACCYLKGLRTGDADESGQLRATANKLIGFHKGRILLTSQLGASMCQADWSGSCGTHVAYAHIIKAVKRHLNGLGQSLQIMI